MNSVLMSTPTDIRRVPHSVPATPGVPAQSMWSSWAQQAWAASHGLVPQEQQPQYFGMSPRFAENWPIGPLQETPIINVSAAPNDDQSQASQLDGLFPKNDVNQMPVATMPPPTLPANHSSPALNVANEPLSMPMGTVQPSLASGQVQRPERGPRTFLKVDVNMGFTSDGRNESPTMLQPVSHWKKRRSVSDVGPRTPSMFGLSPENEVPTSLDDIIGILGPLPRSREPRDDNSMNFEALNLQGEEETASNVSYNDTATPEVATTGLPTMDAPMLELPGHVSSQVSPVTLDPSLIQHNKAIDEALLATLDTSGAGPIRTKTGVRSHGASPYSTPQRVSPELDAPGFDSDPLRSWRFPGAQVMQQDALHPMDAHYGDLSIRRPSTGRGSRRHMRAALSEDLQSPMARSVSTASTPDWLGMTTITGEDPAFAAAGNSGRSGRRHVKSASVQCAAQSLTPVVTTSAAQAASVSRRKAEAQFVCPFPDCSSTFTRQYNLRGHMRSHMDQRPFKCDWPGCGRSFARTHDCKRHQNLHLNIKPYACDSCGKTFARLDALNRHHKSEGGNCGLGTDECT